MLMFFEPGANIGKRNGGGGGIGKPDMEAGGLWAAVDNSAVLPHPFLGFVVAPNLDGIAAVPGLLEPNVRRTVSKAAAFNPDEGIFELGVAKGKVDKGTGAIGEPIENFDGNVGTKVVAAHFVLPPKFFADAKGRHMDIL